MKQLLQQLSHQLLQLLLLLLTSQVALYAQGAPQLTAVTPNDFVTTFTRTAAFSNLQFNALTTDSVSYSYTTNLGKSGSGKFFGPIIQSALILPLGNTITANEVLTFVIEPTHLKQIQFGRLGATLSGTSTFLTDVSQWGSTAWGSMDSTFMGCSNLNITATDVPNLSGVSSMRAMFQDCDKINGPANIGTWNTATVTDMNNLFASAPLFNQNIGSWNTTNVTNMTRMFSNASDFNQNIGGWNTGKVTTMSQMFSNTALFNQPIGSWNTGSVTRMDFMFTGAIAFNQDISYNAITGAWNTANVTDMNSLFFSASAFNQNIGNWNTAKVTDMSNMFCLAAAFNQNLSSWDVSQVSTMQSMFEEATAFNNGNSPNINNWNTAKVTSMSGMFRSATAFNQNIGSWNTGAVIFMGNMFRSTTAFNQNIAYNATTGAWNTAKVTDMNNMFRNATAFNQNIGNWDVSMVSNMGAMFNGATAFNQNLGTWTLRANVVFNQMATQFLANSGMNCANYSSTLVGWANNPATPNGRTFGATGRQYGTDAVAARTKLDIDKTWTFIGDAASGMACLPTPNLATIPNQAICAGQTTSNIAITLGGDLDAVLSATNDNAGINPTYTFGGTGANRTLTIATTAGQLGATTVTATATGIGGTATTSFLLTTTTCPNTTLLVNGELLTIATDCIVAVNGDVQINAGSTFTNNGNIAITGNITNNQVMAAPANGSLAFNGTAAQSLAGAATFFAKNVTMNNAAGISLLTPLRVDGTFTFTNGIVTAASNTIPLLFTANATATNATDASHVNGYVAKEGTGTFAYPVGNGTNYQKVEANLTVNSAGMLVKYFAADAGTAPFTTGGSEATPLGGYNNKEYWDISPLGTATGNVTIFWDGYNDAFDNYKSSRRVAHKTGGAWVNEGINAVAGNEFVGQLTSNNISTWSPFALGSTVVILPLNLLQFTGNKQAGYNQLNWATANEQNTKHFELESSSDGRSFAKIATVNAAGTGNHNYNYNDKTVYNGKVYYRLKMVDADGKFTYSTVLLINQSTNQPITIYPNPATDIIYIKTTSMLNTVAQLTDAKGAVVQSITLTQNQQAVNVQQLATGVYLLKFTNGATQRFIKK
jgi:surface protein